MFRVELQTPERLLRICFFEQVGSAELERCAEEIAALVTSIDPGFRVLTDLTNLESMDPGCAPHIGAIMDFLREHGVELAIRVVPDPHKDIGLNILSFFHYGPDVRTETYENLEQAMESLAA